MMTRSDSRRGEAPGRSAGDESRSDEFGRGSAADGGTAAEPVVCPSCGSEVPEGARSCPVCHRGVYRTCFCGWQLPANERTCPNCGADWSQSTRVARKTKSRAAKNRTIIRYAGLGALIAVAAALVVHMMLTGLAMLAADGQQTVPGGFGERVGLAARGVARVVGRAWAALARHGDTILLIVAVMAVGAIGGVAVYMLQKGNTSRHPGRTTRRVRRKRRK